jgi:hypothetical protein
MVVAEQFIEKSLVAAVVTFAKSTKNSRMMGCPVAEVGIALKRNKDANFTTGLSRSENDIK